MDDIIVQVTFEPEIVATGPAGLPSTITWPDILDRPDIVNQIVNNTQEGYLTVDANGDLVVTTGGGGVSSWNDLTDKPTIFPSDIASVDGLSTALAGKQDTLVSGTNIKSVNGESLLGAGNLLVTGDTGPQGLSAYQVAQANGFTGSQAEWLESLRNPGQGAFDQVFHDPAKVITTDTYQTELTLNVVQGRTYRLFAQVSGIALGMATANHLPDVAFLFKDSNGDAITVGGSAQVNVDGWVEYSFLIGYQINSIAELSNPWPNANGTSTSMINIVGARGVAEFEGFVVAPPNAVTCDIQVKAPDTINAVQFDSLAFYLQDLSELRAAPAGENLGSGAAIYAGMDGTDLQFRSLTAGSNVTLTPSANEIEIDVDLSSKQDTLVSGTNIKSFNGQSILAAGDLNLQTWQFINNYTKPDMSVLAVEYDDSVTFNNTKVFATNLIVEGSLDVYQDIVFWTPTVQVPGGDLALQGGINQVVIRVDGDPFDSRDLTTKGYVDGQVNTKQDTLVSGTTIKTINGESILGSGNITVSGGGGSTAWQVITSNTTLTKNGKYLIKAAVTVTLPDDFALGDEIAIAAFSPTTVLRNGNTIAGQGVDLTLAAGESVYLAASAANTLEVV